MKLKIFSLCYIYGQNVLNWDGVGKGVSIEFGFIGEGAFVGLLNPVGLLKLVGHLELNLNTVEILELVRLLLLNPKCTLTIRVICDVTRSRLF